MRNWFEMNPSTLVLARGELASIRLRGGVYRITCVAGRLWVTVTGQPEDSVLAPGDEMSCTGRGRMVVQALRTATMRAEIHVPAAMKARAPFSAGRLSAGLFSRNALIL